MISITKLHEKRVALQSSLEQIVGQANRVNGAIAVIDELLQAAAEDAKQEALAPAEPHSDQP